MAQRKKKNRTPHDVRKGAALASGRPAVSILIPVFNKLDFTARCLQSLAKVRTRVPFEVIVVDNGSTDGTPGFLRSLGGKVRIVTLAENRGFSCGNNEGARLARGDYLVLLNNDTVVLDGFLEALLEPFQRDPRAGVTGGKLLYPEDETVQHAGLVIGKHSKVFYHLYRHFARNHPAVNRERSLQAVTGACLCVPKGLYEALGGLDEAFRNGGEDADFCMRVRAKGCKVVYTPRCEVLHFEGRTAGRGDHIEQNRRLLVERWGGALVQDDAAIYEEDGYEVEAYVPDAGFDDLAIESFQPRLRLRPDFIRSRAREILVVKPSGIGNMILATPALAALREAFPAARITMVCFRPDSQVLGGLVDKTLILTRSDPRNGLPDPDELEELIPEGKYDLALYPPFTQFSEPTAYLKRAVPYHLTHDRVDYHHRHEVELNMDLVRRLGWEGETPGLFVPVGSPSPGLAGKTVVGVHMGAASADHSKAKKWPPEHWAAFLSDLPEGYAVAFLGGPRERREAEEVAARVRAHGPRECLVLAGSMSLADTAAAIRQCRVFVSHDSGLMHVAAAVGTPVLGVFGPTLPSKNAPWTPGGISRVVRKEIPCSPCYHLFSKLVNCDHRMCLTTLEPAAVREAFDDLERTLEEPACASSGVAVSEWPAVDMLMSTYNRHRYLKRSILSIVAQEYPHWKLWIANDGGASPRDIVTGIGDERIHLLELPHAGKSAALNRAIEASAAPWVGYLDDDDVLLRNHLSTLLEAAREDPRVAFLYSDTYKVFVREYADGTLIERARELENVLSVDVELILTQNYINHKNILHRRELFERAGTYDPELQTLIDWDFIRRLFFVTLPRRVPVVTGEYYVYEKRSSRSHQITGMWERDPGSYTAFKNRVLSKPVRLAPEVRERLACKVADTALARSRLAASYQLLMRRGTESMEEKRWLEALRFFEEAAGLRPSHPDPALRRGKCLVELGRMREAAPFLESGMRGVEGLARNGSRNEEETLRSGYLYSGFLLAAFHLQAGNIEAGREVLVRMKAQHWMQLSEEQRRLMAAYEEKLSLNSERPRSQSFPAAAAG
jgi:GT2 family glycosyltransferase/ADP-heptose:LPS heptosyltransferase